MRIIDADNLKKELRQCHECQNCPHNGQRLCRDSCYVNEFADLIDNAPTINLVVKANPDKAVAVLEMLKASDTGVLLTPPDVEVKVLEPERPRGKWVKEHGNIECNLCGCWFYLSELNDGKANYCPNCGAQMSEEVQE